MWISISNVLKNVPRLISRKDHQARTYGSSSRYSTKLKCKKYLLAMCQVSFPRVLQTLQSVSCSFLRILPCFLPCKAFPRIANEALQTLLSLQLFISASPTISQLFSSLYCTMLSAMQGIPEHSQRGPANPTVVQLWAFHHALCGARRSQAQQMKPCKPYSQSVVHFFVFYHAFCSAKHSRA